LPIRRTGWIPSTGLRRSTATVSGPNELADW